MQKQMGPQGRGDAGTRRAWARWPACVLPVLACLAFLVPAQPARATFHEISIREVYPGGASGASYVELQMWAGAQNFVKNHHLVAYGSAGNVIEDFKFAADVASGANQATILLADTGYAGVFDEEPVPDASDASLDLQPSGGAVCWTEGSPPDCVAWGDFKGPLPAHVPELKVGSPASPAGVTAGKALRRSIANGCATLLDPPPTDDSDNSAVDFSEVDPKPRNNAITPTETVCPSLPNTTIVGAKPANPTNLTTASFTYQASPAAGASFECSLAKSGDPDDFEACPGAGKSYSELAEGSYVFKVRAVNSAGTDPTPASHPWTVDLTAPTVTVQSGPAKPSAGNSAAFTYSANEAGSTFQCSLEPSGEAVVFTACASTGKSYPDLEHPAPLADGEWTFAVRAIDKAGNQGTPEPFPLGTYSWTVDNSLADTTPPETTILSRPPDPSGSASASFTYGSNEAGSSFQCELDGAGFVPCPASGVPYSGLGNGPHTFRVRAIDTSGNVDPTPAGYSFSVVLLAQSLVPPPPASPAPSAAAPNTVITAKPASRTHDRTPTFRFRSPAAKATFQCKLDGGPYVGCRSPFTTKRLSPGPHAFQVRARAGGLTDQTPAKLSFRVVRG